MTDDSPNTSAGKKPGRSQTVELQRRALRGSVLALGNQALKLVSNFVTTFIVALYLEPEEVGLFAVAFSIQVLLIIVRDGGLANSLIQKKDLTDTHINSVLWISVGISLVLIAGLAAVARPLARYYEQPQLAAILWLTTLPIVAQAVGSVQETLFRKHLKFGRLLMADAGSTLLASIAAIVAVVLGAGVWGLVLRMVAAPVLLTIICWSLSSWRPRWEFSFQAIRSLWAFGGFMFLAVLTGYGASRLDSLIIGKLIGVSDAGLFFMARYLTLALISEAVIAVGRVMFSVFSAIQDDLANIRSGYLTGTRCLAVLIFPLVAGIVVLAPEAIPLFLEDTWIPAAPVMQIISLHGLLLCLLNPANQTLYALGRSRLVFVISLIAGLATLASFVVGCRWGVIGVAVSWTIVRLIYCAVMLRYASREVNLTVKTAVTNLARPLIAAAGAACAVLVLHLIWTSTGGSVGLVLFSLEVLAGLLAYALLCRLLLMDTLTKLWHDGMDSIRRPGVTRDGAAS